MHKYSGSPKLSLTFHSGPAIVASDKETDIGFTEDSYEEVSKIIAPLPSYTFKSTTWPVHCCFR